MSFRNLEVHLAICSSNSYSGVVISVSTAMECYRLQETPQEECWCFCEVLKCHFYHAVLLCTSTNCTYSAITCQSFSWYMTHCFALKQEENIYDFFFISKKRYLLCFLKLEAMIQPTRIKYPSGNHTYFCGQGSVWTNMSSFNLFENSHSLDSLEM